MTGLIGRCVALAWGSTLILSTVACSNNPYPKADDSEKVLYLPFATPPKTLDPAISYGTADTVVTSKVYDTLLEYHYLKRPYTLEPGMARDIPKAKVLEDGRVQYSFELREEIWFATDPCFALSGQPKDRLRRRVTAQDFVFELSRIADPALASPVVETFSILEGLVDFGARLKERREKDPQFSKLPAQEQYRAVGGFPGARAPDDDTFILTLQEPYPQMLYWFAMPFTTPVPWEAIQYYDGNGGRPPFAEHPVSTGSFVMTRYDKQARIAFERNPHWWGLAHPDAPGAKFPDVTGIAGSEDMQASVGKPLPFLDRIEYRREQETIPAFSKFLQGYYDMSGISRESFDKIVHEGGLSAEMAERGMHLSKTVDPGVYYIGFNLEDPRVGTAAGEKSRLLRQAMSLAVDVTEYLRLFSNGRGLPAQSPIPPGIFGYEEAYKNPYRTPDVERAKALLARAGYKNGIDPGTGAPLRLTFDVADTSAEGRVRYLFWVNQWRRIGLNVTLEATNYNQFYAKMLKGSYQIYSWGWMADYPDPENFLFLLSGPMARSVSGGPNNANFQNAEYDRLFGLMQSRENDPERLEIIRNMRTILEQERPWIELFHPESYALYHGWLRNVRPVGLSTIPTARYYQLDPQQRAEKREAWNRPVYWPAWVLALLTLAVLVPGVLTYYRERT